MVQSAVGVVPGPAGPAGSPGVRPEVPLGPRPRPRPARPARERALAKARCHHHHLVGGAGGRHHDPHPAVSSPPPAAKTVGLRLARLTATGAQALTAALLFHQPEDPKAFLKEFLGKLKGDDVNTLITDEDLEVMFSMFDLGGTGRINVNQTNQAIKMMVGEEASLLMDEGNHVSKDEFVETCRKSLGKF